MAERESREQLLMLNYRLRKSKLDPPLETIYPVENWPAIRNYRVDS